MNFSDMIATSWVRETKYTVLLHGTEFEEGNQEEKIQSDTIEVSNNFIS